MMAVEAGAFVATADSVLKVWMNHAVTRINMESYEQLKKLIEDAADDVAKAEGGNKAAGTRVRKAMQEIKKVAQELRVGILGARS